MLIAYANANGWHIYHGDVSSAFLHAKVPADKPPIYVRVPEGFPSYMDDNGLPSYISTRTRICAYRLWKSLYGLVEAPRWWYEHIHALLISYGFIQSPTDPCLYNRDLGTPKAIQLGLIVDDFLIIAITVATIMSFQEQLSRDVKLSQFEKVSVFLGIRVRDDKHCVSLDQQQYITQLLEKCKMADVLQRCTDPCNFGRTRPLSRRRRTGDLLETICAICRRSSHARLRQHQTRTWIRPSVSLQARGAPRTCTPTGSKTPFTLSPAEQVRRPRVPAS